jgi:hypothetical protein
LERLEDQSLVLYEVPQLRVTAEQKHLVSAAGRRPWDDRTLDGHYSKDPFGSSGSNVRWAAPAVVSARPGLYSAVVTQVASLALGVSGTRLPPRSSQQAPNPSVKGPSYVKAQAALYVER